MATGRLAISIALLGLPAVAASYRFTNVADNTDFVGFGPYPPGLNDSGIAVFYGLHFIPRVKGIYTGSGGALTAVVDDAPASQYQDFNARPWINNHGDVAFRATHRGVGVGIFLAGSGSFTTLADTSAGFFQGLELDEPSLNDSGAVAFRATVGSGAAIFRVQAGNVTTIAEAKAPDWLFADFDHFPPAIGSGGEVVFLGEKPVRGWGIYRGSGGGVTTVVEASTGGFSELYSPSLSDSGRVLFGGYSGSVPPYDQVKGIYDGPDLTANCIVDSSGPFRGFGAPFLNAVGQFAFVGSLDAGGIGLFAGTDPVTNRVIVTGDELFGATLTDLSFYRGLNNRGQLAFYYELSNGRTGIAIATPESAIPRPVFTNITASALTAKVVASGTNGLPNAPYWVLASTNVALPLTNWARLATNVFDPGGNFSFTNTLDSNRPWCFYGLQVP